MSGAGFAGACAFEPVWERALGECMDGLALPAGANLGFLYFSDRYADEAESLFAAVREESGIEHWVGSVGLGVIGSGEAHIGRPGMSMLVGRFPDDSFRVFSGRAPLRTGKDDEEPYFAVVHGDPHTEDMSGLVAADYAGPAVGVPVDNVRDRYFLGYCQQGIDWDALFAEFDANREPILELDDRLPGMSRSSQRFGASMTSCIRQSPP